MKKLMLGLLAAAIAASASADYKTIELENGTNAVQIAGAYRPVAIEVKSTVSTKLVTVNRASDVVILRKCYDITTNDVSWDEMLVTTNDYYNMSFGGLHACAEYATDTPYTSPYDTTLTRCGDRLLWRNECYTNAMFLGAVTTVAKGEIGAVSTIGSACYGKGVYVVQEKEYLGWTEDFVSFKKPLSGVDTNPGQTLIGVTNYQSVAFGNGVFVATAFSKTYPNDKVWYRLSSTDGKNWVKASGGIGSTVTFCGSRFFSYGETNKLFTSQNGVDWSVALDETATCVSYGNGVYLVGVPGKACHYSASGTSWSPSDGEGIVSNATAIAFHEGSGIFLVGNSESVTASSDGRSFYEYGGLQNYGWKVAGEYLYANYKYTDSGNTYYKMLVYKTGDSVSLPYKSTYSTVSTSWKDTQSNEKYELRHTYLSGISSPLNNYWVIYDVTGEATCDSVDYRNPLPDSVTFKYPSAAQTSEAVRIPSRVTNWVHHAVYQYVTNRVWNVIDHNVTKIAGIASARCTDGISSQNLTNSVFLLNGDSLIVEGIEVSDTESTKATLICE